MMPDGYLLPRRKALICRIAGALFLFLAACSASSIAFSAFLPETLRFAEGMRWEVTSRPEQVLPLEDQQKVKASPATRQAFAAYLERPGTRLGMVGIDIIKTAPFALLLFGVGLALRRLGRRTAGSLADTLAGALPWLRRASIAAIVWALAGPVADSLLAMLLYPGTPAGPHWSFTIDFNGIGIALMLAIAAYATVWALEAGLQAQQDLAGFV